VIGRPVDVAEGPDGAFYVSDDYAGAIYRVAFGEESHAGTTTPAPAAHVTDPLVGMPAAERTARAAHGAALYRELGCAGCHETAAAPAGVVPPPLTHLASRWTVEGLVAFLAAPTPPMPAVERSEADRRDLAVHLLSAHH
jgi:mono/diheme cytochrome c family protein